MPGNDKRSWLVNNFTIFKGLGNVTKLESTWGFTKRVITRYLYHLPVSYIAGTRFARFVQCRSRKLYAGRYTFHILHSFVFKDTLKIYWLALIIYWYCLRCVDATSYCLEGNRQSDMNTLQRRISKHLVPWIQIPKQLERTGIDSHNCI